MPKKAAPKVPRNLKALLKGNQEISVDNKGVAQILGKGIKGTAIEIGAGEKAALVSISNEGQNTIISLATPFGRPPLEAGQVQEVPEAAATKALLSPQNETEFEAAWAEASQEVTSIEDPPESTEEEEEETPEEEDPFAIVEEAIVEEEVAEQASLATEEQTEESEINLAEMMEEMAELRKANQELREKYAVASHKNGSTKAIEALQLAQQELATLRAQAQEPTESLQLPDWEGQQLQILFPCHKFTNPATTIFLWAMAKDFGPKIGIIPGVGDARIANTRNRLAHQFLELGSEWSLFIDDDMIPMFGRSQVMRPMIGASDKELPEAVMNTHCVQRLLASGKKLIGATYFGRRRNAYAMFKDGIDNPSAYQKAKDHTGELIATDWVATGCLLIHRDVYLAIQKKFPELAPTKTRLFWDFFREGEGQDGGEDVEFCKRAKASGFQPYVDTGAQAAHVGLCAYGFWNTIASFQAAAVGNREGKWW